MNINEAILQTQGIKKTKFNCELDSYLHLCTVCMYYGMYLQIKKVTFSSVPVQNRLKQCFKHTFGRISELLIASIFEYHIL